MGKKLIHNNVVTTQVMAVHFFRVPGEPGLAGAPGLSGNYPPVPLNPSGSCVPCPNGPAGPKGAPGGPGPAVHTYTVAYHSLRVNVNGINF